MQIEILIDLPNYKRGDRPHLKPHIAETMVAMGYARAIDQAPREAVPGLSQSGPADAQLRFVPVPMWGVETLTSGKLVIAWYHTTEVRYYEQAPKDCPPAVAAEFKRRTKLEDQKLLASAAGR